MTRYVDPNSGAGSQPGGFVGNVEVQQHIQPVSGGTVITPWPTQEETLPFGLGRNMVPDLRDLDFPMASAIPKTSSRTNRYWNAEGAWLNQENFPHCVGASWTHYLKDGPVTYDKKVDMAYASQLYREAQKVDQWPGENYDGTSVRAGAQILQSRGLLGTYTWAYDAKTVIKALLEVGPVVVGTVWTMSMFRPDPTGLLNVSGKAAGGHAYLLNGVNTKTERVRIKNSWGRGWDDNGFALLSFTDLDRLLKAQGEACLAVEIENPPASV